LVLLATALIACSSSPDDKGFELLSDTAPSDPRPSTTTPATPATSEALSTTTTTVPGYVVEVAYATGEVEVYPAPRAPTPSRVLPATTILGSPTVLPILSEAVSGWVEVALPGRPNESTGWVEAEPFSYAQVDQRIEISLAEATLTLYVRDEPVLSSAVAIGSPENPTPPGWFFVTDIVELTDPTGPWGPHALGLSARSETVTEFNGGDGIIGIHGTNRPNRIGEAVSLGCVRVPNDVITRLAGLVALGVPVVIAP
jgi:lipoprotein-anchoring transpeptidase ErfK/SrfK